MQFFFAKIFDIALSLQIAKIWTCSNVSSLSKITFNLGIG